MPTVKKAVKEILSPKVTKSKYQVEITVNGETVKIGANDMHEALKSFVAPDSIKTETMIRVTKDKKTAEKEINVNDSRRAFGGSNVSLELLASNLEKFLG